MDIRYDMRIKTINEFKDFIGWANKNNLKWECGRDINIFDWKSVEDRISVFWFIDNKFTDFETSASVTYNCKDIVHYISTNIYDFLKIN